jgi:stringent starvation protein B
MAAPTRLPPKKDVALALLEQSIVSIHLDPRIEGVRVPAWFMNQPQLVLEVGLNMPVPIPDLDVGDEGISCTLSFNRTPHFCWIPWSSVFALVGKNSRGMVWPDDVPKEVAAQAAQQQKKETSPKLRSVPAQAAPAEAKPKKKRARKTKRSEAAAEPKPQPARAAAREARPAQPQPASSQADDSKRRRELPPYLRVIK